MEIEELKTKVIAIIAEHLGKKAEEIKVEAKMVEDLKVDDLDSVEIIMALEEEFGIAISDEDAEKLSTVDDLVAYVFSKVEKKEPPKSEPKPKDKK